MASGVVCDGLDGCRFVGCLQKRAVVRLPGDVTGPPPPQIWAPARLGPGSPGVVPETASSWLLGRPLEATTVSRWLEKLPTCFLDFFGSQLDPSLGSFWAPLGTPRDPKMQYVLRFLNVFAYSRLMT